MRAAGSEKYDPVPGLLRVRPAAPERRSKYDLWSWVRSHTIGSMGTQARASLTPSGCTHLLVAVRCGVGCRAAVPGCLSLPVLLSRSLARAATAALCAGGNDTAGSLTKHEQCCALYHIQRIAYPMAFSNAGHPGGGSGGHGARQVRPGAAAGRAGGPAARLA